MLKNQNQAYSCLCDRTKHTHAYEPKPSIIVLNCPRNGIFLCLKATTKKMTFRKKVLKEEYKFKKFLIGLPNPHCRFSRRQCFTCTLILVISPHRRLIPTKDSWILHWCSFIINHFKDKTASYCNKSSEFLQTFHGCTPLASLVVESMIGLPFAYKSSSVYVYIFSVYTMQWTMLLSDCS